MFISAATVRNWNKLCPNPQGKLQSRANKTRSSKRFIPVERLANSESQYWIENLISRFHKKNYDIESILLTLSLNIFRKHHIDKQLNVQDFLSEHSKLQIIESLIDIDVPEELDILGTVYQSYLTEGTKNALGSYYTPPALARKIVSSMAFSAEGRLLDPCCGSGAFLISAPELDPAAIVGLELDPTAAMIAKANLLLAYPGCCFTPQVFICDFLEPDLMATNQLNSLGRFDLIATNPPWGAAVGACQTESSTNFFIKSLSLLKNDGAVNFLFPVSVLNVKAHKAFRQFLLENELLRRIHVFDARFSGVLTKFASISADRRPKLDGITFTDGHTTASIDVSEARTSANCTFTMVSNLDAGIISKIRSKAPLNLKNSRWALGIVTGDNKNKLHEAPGPHEEPIYTGKEIQPFVLKQPSKYILFDRSRLQQVARDEFYRAPEKLVYKFITKKLMFAYDDTRSLCLNSANILIPKIDGMSIKSVMAFLNSTLYQYLYIKLFNELKILKGNLQELPFPVLSQSENEQLTELVNHALRKDANAVPSINEWVYQYYALNNSEISHITETVDGTIN